MVKHNFTSKLCFSDATFDERKCKNISKFYVLSNKKISLHISNIKPEIQVHVHIFLVCCIYLLLKNHSYTFTKRHTNKVRSSIYYLIKVKIVYIIFSQSFITVVNSLYIVYFICIKKCLAEWLKLATNIYLDNDKNTFRPD